MSKIIWVLTDERPGNTNQALGVAEALGQPFVEKKLQFTREGELPNFLLQAALKMGRPVLNDMTQIELWKPLPDMVIAAGRRCGQVARYIKSKSRGTKIVQIMDPGFPRGAYDLLVVPYHDQMRTAPNMMHTVGSPHRLTPAILERAKAEWQENFAVLPRPHVALLVGGITKKGKGLNEEAAVELMRRVSAMTAKLQGSLLITTSRRTSAELTETLKPHVTVPSYFHTWTAEARNPYLGFLGDADYIIVSGDSLSMCSEASATGKPVYIYAPPGMVSKKHARLHQQLYAANLARPLESDLGHWAYKPLTVAKDVAKRIEALWK